MRKIINILLALSLVLALSAIAAPAMADVEGPVGPKPVVVVTNTDCACDTGVYNITFNISASLTEGVHCVCIEFPEGTDVPTSFLTGEITIEGDPVFASEITVTGDKVCFLPPAHYTAALNNPIEVIFTKLADIGNPCVPGQYTLFVSTCREPDKTPVESEEYTIRPEYSKYAFEVDFGPTYPGIAKDFIPPFKMCGQNDTAQNLTIVHEPFDTVYNASIPGWLTVFNFTFLSSVVGCKVPCVDATIWFEVVTCPADEVITLGLNGTWFTLDNDDETVEVGEYGLEDFVVDPALGLNTTMSVTWNASLHFSSVGKYEICFYAECPEITGCDPEAEEIIAERCLEFSVHQWKDAYKIPLCRKWNLISLPLVPLIDPPISTPEKTGIMDSYALLDEVISIWYLDRNAPMCDGDEWLLWSNTPATDTLTDMEDGKAYWIRITYNSTHPMGSPADGVWVWGTPKPVPPASPSAYDVCDGWNMIGFTSMAPMWDGNYLWNFPFGAGGHGAVYGWDNCGWYGPAQTWVRMCHNVQMLWPGDGYFASFDGPGTIFPP